ncbi:MAG: DUF4826 family protein [Spirochaetales bacterium]|nr:DUF4826 family protein [Spirochaetales bacterium]
MNIHEEWTNKEYTNVLDYLSEKQIPYNGRVFLEWVSAPFVSLWYIRSSKNDSSKYWIMHNLEFTDILEESDSLTVQEVLYEFGEKWFSKDLDFVRIRDKNANLNEKSELLYKHGQMLKNISEDKELWSNNGK